MYFLLQRDDVCLIERRAVQHAAGLIDAQSSLVSLEKLQSEGIPLGVPVDVIPVGTVEFVSAFMTLRGIRLPPHLTYPLCLRSFLQRKVWVDLFGLVDGYDFVKPLHEIKRFTGGVRDEIENKDMIAPNLPVWVSEPVHFIAEWRYYIRSGHIVGAGRYDDGDDGVAKPDISMVLAAVDKMTKSGECPAGYALDFGVLDDGRTALIEANDGWALGYYKGESDGIRCYYEGPCSAKDYALLLSMRWLQLISSTSLKTLAND